MGLARLTTHVHIMLSLRVTGAIPPWCGQGHLYLVITIANRFVPDFLN